MIVYDGHIEEKEGAVSAQESPPFLAVLLSHGGGKALCCYLLGVVGRHAAAGRQQQVLHILDPCGQSRAYSCNPCGTTPAAAVS